MKIIKGRFYARKMLYRLRGVVIFFVLLGMFFLHPAVRALDLVNTANIIKETFLKEEKKSYGEELLEGEFLILGKHPDFQVYFGDRAKGGKHRVKVLKEGLSFEFAFLEATGTDQAGEEALLGINTANSDYQEATSSALSKEGLSKEQKQALENIEAQIEDIKLHQATLSAKLVEAKKEAASIDKAIKQIVPGTNIGFDELDKKQMIVRNSQVEPGMDIYYWKKENNLREKIIIRKPPLFSKLVFSLNTEGLTAFNIGSGVIYFKDKKGQNIFRITKGYIKDLTNAFSNEVETKVENNQLIHQLDQKWLNSPDRVYPLSLYFDFQLLEEEVITKQSGDGALLEKSWEEKGEIIKELKDKRTLFSKTFVKNDGSFQEKIWVGPVHYPEEDGKLEEINTNFTPSSLTDYDYEVVKGFFKTRFKKNLNSAGFAQYLYQGQEVQLELGNLSWVNDKGEEEIISPPQPAEAIPEGNLLRYPRAYGPGTGVEFLYHPQYLGKYLVINQYEDLKKNKAATEASALKFDFKMKIGAEVKIFLEGQEWDGKETSTQEGVEFKNLAGETIFSFKKPYAQDSQGEQKEIKLVLKKDGNWVFISKLIDASWLAQASYPIKADADIIYLDGDAYDMYNDSKNGDQDGSTTLIVGKAAPSIYDGYWAFAISQTIYESTINSVTFTGNISSNDIDVDAIIYGLQSEDCPAHEGGDPSLIGVTTNSQAWTNLSTGITGSQTSPAITSIFTEWINDYQPGRTGTDRFGMKIDDSNTGNSREVIFSDYQSGSTTDTYLTVDYTPANSAPTAPTTLYTNETDASSGVVNPSAVGDSSPVFSAIYNDSDAGDVADDYQLVVYSDSGCTNQVWDSTKTVMSNCTQGNRCLTASGVGIEFGGTALDFDGAQYYWKIKYWDDDDGEGTFSDCSDNFYILGPGDQMRYGNYFFNKTSEQVFTW